MAHMYLRGKLHEKLNHCPNIPKVLANTLSTHNVSTSLFIYIIYYGAKVTWSILRANRDAPIKLGAASIVVNMCSEIVTSAHAYAKSAYGLYHSRITALENVERKISS